MFKVFTGLIIVVGLWVCVEIMNEGPSSAFGGLFKNFVSDSSTAATEYIDEKRTAHRAGDAVARARDEANARRERLLNQ
jgi:hypothetical protein